MTFVDVKRLLSYWKTHPAHGELLNIAARCLGWKPPSQPAAIDDRRQSFRDLKAMFPDGVIR